MIIKLFFYFNCHVFLNIALPSSDVYMVVTLGIPQLHLQHVKSLKVIIPILKTRKSEKTENQIFSWIHQRIEVTKQTTILKFGKRQISKCSESQWTHVYLKQKTLEPHNSSSTVSIILTHYWRLSKDSYDSENSWELRFEKNL